MPIFRIETLKGAHAATDDGFMSPRRIRLALGRWMRSARCSITTGWSDIYSVRRKLMGLRLMMAVGSFVRMALRRVDQ
ncbi:MAG: hypothetical protein M3340_01675 [Actinomycetota bacterium]|nr:hypothetical protein [Actinomycetota bacterium]